MSRKRRPPDELLEQTARRYWRAHAQTYRPGGADRRDFLALRDVAMEARAQLLPFMPSAEARALLEALAGHAMASAQDEQLRRRTAAAYGKLARHSARAMAGPIIARRVEDERRSGNTINASQFAQAVLDALKAARCPERPSKVTVRRWIAEARKAGD